MKKLQESKHKRKKLTKEERKELVAKVLEEVWADTDKYIKFIVECVALIVSLFKDEWLIEWTSEQSNKEKK